MQVMLFSFFYFTDALLLSGQEGTSVEGMRSNPHLSLSLSLSCSDALPLSLPLRSPLLFLHLIFSQLLFFSFDPHAFQAFLFRCHSPYLSDPKPFPLPPPLPSSTPPPLTPPLPSKT